MVTHISCPSSISVIEITFESWQILAIFCLIRKPHAEPSLYGFPSFLACLCFGLEKQTGIHSSYKTHTLQS